MQFHFTDTDEGRVLKLDDVAIRYLEAGLDRLADAQPGESFSTPMLADDGVGEFILERA